MDYGGVDKRKSKNDKRKKRINRGYKKGGKFRSQNIEESRKKSKEEKNSKDKKRKK
jgi:hypothetical protein